MVMYTGAIITCNKYTHKSQKYYGLYVFVESHVECIYEL